MMKVKSNPTLNLLTKKFIKKNKSRNIIAIIAIAMTTIMFTSVFTATISLINSNMNMEMRTAMTTSQLAIQNMTKEQFESVIQDKSIKSYGYTILMTLAENEALKNSSVEIRYADDNGAKDYMSYPTTGKMPHKENEIALNTITLDLLGIPYELGSTVPITTTLNGKKISKNFTLSGYWKGDSIPLVQMAWVSEEFCLENTKVATADAIENGDYEGIYNLSILFPNIWGLTEKMDALDETYQISQSQAKISIPPAYDRLIGEDGFPFEIIILILALIFISGYLIIFNVFYISVRQDIKEYGLLKSIGTTGRQLGKIVTRQALFLCAFGIPLGIVLGYFAGISMTPFLLEGGIGTESNLVAKTEISPLIFLIAAAFSLGTVYLACQKPSRTAAKFSPIEAVRMEDTSTKSNKKHTGNVTPFFMAAGNIRRIWKKALVVILSLTLPIIILNVIRMIQVGFDYDKFIDIYISSDFNVSGCTNNLRTSNLNAITRDMRKDFKMQDMVESIAYVYDTETYHSLNEKEYNNLSKILKKAKEDGTIKGKHLEREEAYLAEKSVVSHILGIDKNAFDTLEILNGNVTWEEFETGNYVIITDTAYPQWGSYFDVNDKVELEVTPGKIKTYSIIAAGQLPYDMRYPFGSGTYFDYTFHLPAQEFFSMGGNENAKSAHFEIEDKKEKAFGRWLEQYINENQYSLYTNSVLELEKQCAQFAGKYYLVLGSLGGIIFIIGILNFFNTSAVSILGRKKELSLLEALGMTKKQIQRMLSYESIYYLLAAVILANTAGIFAAQKMIEATVGKAFFFTYHLDLSASLLILPVLIVIAMGIPLYNFKKMCQSTIVERIRAEE